MQRCSGPDCGHLNRPGARFCERCGRTLRPERWVPLRAGHLLRGGGYRILKPLGRGGMGALFLLPALAFIGGGIAGELARALIGYALTRFRGRKG